MPNLLKIVFSSILLISAPAMHAKKINWSNHSYTHFSKEEPLSLFLESLAAEQNIPIVISHKVDDIISAYYKEKKLSFIFHELSLTYGLNSFFDGNILYVYKREETQTGTVSLINAFVSDLEKDLRDNELLDDNIRWNVDEISNSVTFSGAKRFVDIVLSKARKLEKNNASTIFQINSRDGIPYFTQERPSLMKDIKKIFKYRVSQEVKVKISDSTVGLDESKTFEKK